MTFRPSSFLLIVFVAVAGCNGGNSERSVNLDDIDNASVAQQASYLLGYQMGSSTSSQMDSVDVGLLDMDILLAAVEESLRGDSIRMDETKAMRALSAFSDTLLMRGLRRDASTDTSAQQYLDEITRNLAASDSFFTALEGTDSLQTSETGVRYIVLTEGEGEAPERGDRVQIEIRTTLMGGELIRGMTTAPNEPVDLVVGNNPIQGLNEALTQMTPGESR
ncbi:MAG: FKBP-type peptidyl-prolyl cis-trans isomerase N-terminal domain-containing protein, partial [Rubricoccaceae bacterium]|nr:FKBP-type peptidyl-prolyl cis-trans isomerase N-terminal domain-containing protein [Rubricoccaceae bacterium]